MPLKFPQNSFIQDIAGGKGSQVETMPTPSQSNVGEIVQYVGITTTDYVNGYFYICTEDTTTTPSTYSWVRKNVQPSSGGAGAVDDVTINGLSVVSQGVAVIPNATASTYGASKAVQVSSMPVASSTYLNQVVQFIGDTTSSYEQGLFYICELQGSTYSWNHLPTDLVASTADFGLVKVNNSSLEPLQVNNGVLSVQQVAQQLTSLPTASSTYVNKIIQFTGVTDSTYTNGYMYKCEQTLESLTATQTSGLDVGTITTDVDEFKVAVGAGLVEGSYVFTATGTAGQPATGWTLNGTAISSITDYGIYFTGIAVTGIVITAIYTANSYNWVQWDVQPAGGTVTDVQVNGTSILDASGVANITNATTSNFGLVKIKSDNSEPLQISSGVLSANKATGSYSLTLSGNSATTNSATNIGVNSVAHGWYALAYGCDAVVGDKTNDVRVAGAIQLGRGSNQEAGTLKVGLSTNGTTWNNYTLLGNDGKVPSGTMSIATASNVGAVKPDGTTITIDANGVISGSAQGANTDLSNLSATGEAHFAKPRTTVADTASTTATIANVEAGKDYTFSQPLTSLTVTANETSMNEATITFTSGASITVTLPASLAQLGSAVTFQPNTTYVLSIWNNKLLVGVQA